MGGDSVRAEEESSSDPDFPRSLSRCSCSFRDDEGINGGDLEEFGPKPPAKFSDFGADRRKRDKAYREVLQSYDRLQERISSLKVAKCKILSYTPGAWVERADGVKLSIYDVPKTTSIILVGPKGSGKSALINRISRVIENDQFAPERAQVSYASCSKEGTFFLHEYMIPRASAAFCIYDTRGLRQNSSDNINTIKQWIAKGVRHGEPVIWKSDSSNLKEILNRKARWYSSTSSETRKVNFVIFVVNGVDILKSMDGDNVSETSYAQTIATTFNCPYLSFKDDKPAVVMTHGDLLSVGERARVRVFLGELLGVPPDKQIFDIPESHDAATELIICDLLRHSLEHAEKNFKILPPRDGTKDKVCGILRSAFIGLLIILAVVAAATIGGMLHVRGSCGRKPEPAVDWHTIRHLWLDLD